MNRPALAVLGAGGFIGTAVAAAAAAEPRMGSVRTAFRTGGGHGAPTVDVCDPASVARVLEQVDIVVNAAHVIGSGPSLSVNEDGPGTVARTAADLGVRCIEIGTAAVYGRGPLCGGAEGTLPIRPDSPLSASRARGEEEALVAGATVVRPMIVVGAGDRWAVPAAAAAAAGDHRAPSARVGVIGIADLARLVVSVALHDDPPPVLHVARRHPVAVADLLSEVGLPPTTGASERADVSEMLHTDRWVDADLAWDLVGWEPQGPVVDHVARQWYAAWLSGSTPRR